MASLQIYNFFQNDLFSIFLFNSVLYQENINFYFYGII